jgi:hypothetical protein
MKSCQFINNRAVMPEGHKVMSKSIHIATSPLTGTIFAGTLLKNGRTWEVDKKDMTIEALVAVAEHALHFGHPVEVSDADGTPVYRITVERLTDITTG